MTLATLPVLALARLFYGDLRFIRCSKRVKRHFAGFVRRLGAEQLTEHDHYKDGNFPLSQKLCIEAGGEKRRRNDSLAKALCKYGGDQGYADLLGRAFNFGWYRDLFTLPFAVSGLNEIAGRVERIDFLSAFPPHVFHWPENTPGKLHFVKFHRPFIAPFQYSFRAGCALVLLLAPFLNAFLYWRKGIRPRFGPAAAPGARKDILYVHRYAFLEGSMTRDMYYLRAGILPIGDCAHYLMATGGNFTEEKVRYLEGPGGEVVHTHDIRPSFGDYFSRVFTSFYAAMVPACLKMVKSHEMNLPSFLQLLELIHLSPLASMLLDQCRPKVVTLETETSPITNIIALEARKRNIHSISMIHGSGAQNNPFANRSDLQYETLLTPGRDHSVLKSANPRVKNVIAVGNHEIDRLYKDGLAKRDDLLPGRLRENRGDYKVVACFLYLFNNFLDTRSFHAKTEYLDEEKCREHALKHLKPLFDWVAARNDVIFVWKPKVRDRAQNDRHPWIAPLIKDIPPERFLVLPDESLVDVIAISDVCLCTGASSVIPSAMAIGKPALAFDLQFGGWLRKYDPLMAAENGEELVENLNGLLEKGLPEEVFTRFNADWYAEGVVDFKTAERIAKVFEERLGNGSEPSKARPEGAPRP